MSKNRFPEATIIATHHDATGQEDLLIEYVRRHTKYFIEIRHPLYSTSDISSHYISYEKSEKINSKKYPFPFNITFLRYFKDFFLTLFICTQITRRNYMYIGINSLNTLVGIILKVLGYVDFVILYEIDMPKNRYSNQVLNYLYHKLDNFCASHVDCVWNLSSRMNQVRTMFGLSPSNMSKNIVVPAVYSPKVPSIPSIKNKTKLIYLGYLIKSRGLQLVIKNLPQILKIVPETKVIVIGKGPYENELKKMVKDFGVENNVNFLGFISDFSDVERILQNSGIGLATYVPDPSAITAYTDPMKVKVYLACGLPVLLTDVPLFAEEVRANKAGIVISYSDEAFVNGVLDLLTNDTKYIKYQNNAINLSQSFFPDKVFKEAIKQTWKVI